jgi:hypothetical protein
MLLKTNGEKKSIFRFSTMFLKRSKLQPFSHDVDEKKGSYRKRMGRGKKKPSIWMSVGK